MDSSIEQYNKLYQTAQDSKEVSNLAYMRNIAAYVDFLENDDFFKSIFHNMRESYLLETSQLEAEYVNAKNTVVSFVRNEIEEKIAERYPFYSFQQLQRARREFRHVKDCHSDEELSEEIFKLVEEDEYGKSWTNTSQKRIVDIAPLIYWTPFNDLHKAILLSLEEVKKKGGVLSKYLSYDYDNGILYFRGKEIKIRGNKRGSHNSHFLLEFIINNYPFKKHYYTDMEESLVLQDKKRPKSYYDACIDINKKVDLVTGIADFIDYNSGADLYVRINPKYQLKAGKQ